MLSKIWCQIQIHSSTTESQEWHQCWLQVFLLLLELINEHQGKSLSWHSQCMSIGCLDGLSIELNDVFVLWMGLLLINLDGCSFVEPFEKLDVANGRLSLDWSKKISCYHMALQKSKFPKLLLQVDVFFTQLQNFFSQLVVLVWHRLFRTLECFSYGCQFLVTAEILVSVVLQVLFQACLHFATASPRIFQGFQSVEVEHYIIDFIFMLSLKIPYGSFLVDFESLNLAFVYFDLPSLIR